MPQRIEVQNAYIEDELLILVADASFLANATGKMLVDSDTFAFIYILEKDDEYIYISITEKFWNELNNGLKTNKGVKLLLNEENIQLTQFFEELNYLIENIEGNANYGEEMVQKVEGAFLKN